MNTGTLLGCPFVVTIGNLPSTVLTMTDASENAILTYLSSSYDSVIDDTFPWSEWNNLDHGTVVGAVKSLMVEDYVAAEDLSTSFYTLSTEAEEILKNGSQEILVMKALVGKSGVSMSELQEAVGNDVAKIGMGNCMKNKWVKKEGSQLIALKGLDEIQDEIQASLKALVDGKCHMNSIDDAVSNCRRSRAIIQDHSNFLSC